LTLFSLSISSSFLSGFKSSVLATCLLFFSDLIFSIDFRILSTLFFCFCSSLSSLIFSFFFFEIFSFLANSGGFGFDLTLGGWKPPLFRCSFFC